MRSPRTCSPPRCRNRRRDRLDRRYVHRVVNDVFGPGLHELRVLSLANGVTGVMNAAVLSLHAIGQAYARVAETSAKSGVKQMDRVVGNSGISVDGASDTGIINKTNNSGVVTPASPYTCMVNCTNNGEIYSFHAGGVHITLGDGSSRFISKSISNQVLLSLITKDAGDVTGEF